MRPLVLGILLSSTVALAQAPGGQPPAAPGPTAGTVNGPQASAPAPAPVAARGNGLSQVYVDDLPEACRDVGKLADSPSPNQALSARISLASCLVEQRMKTVALCDCEQSVRDVEAASAQSMTLLDEVFAVAADPATKILARQVQGDLLASFATRILATVPPLMDASESAATLRETRLSLITPHVTPWQMRAKSAYQELDRIARANPQLAKNPAVVAAVRQSRAKLAQFEAGVAKR